MTIQPVCIFLIASISPLSSLQSMEDLLDLLKKLPSSPVGSSRAVALTLEELEAGGFLEISNKTADRRLGNTQQLGRLTHASKRNDCPEGFDLTNVYFLHGALPLFALVSSGKAIAIFSSGPADIATADTPLKFEFHEGSELAQAESESRTCQRSVAQ